MYYQVLIVTLFATSAYSVINGVIHVDNVGCDGNTDRIKAATREAINYARIADEAIRANHGPTMDIARKLFTDAAGIEVARERLATIAAATVSDQFPDPKDSTWVPRHGDTIIYCDFKRWILPKKLAGVKRDSENNFDAPRQHVDLCQHNPFPAPQAMCFSGHGSRNGAIQERIDTIQICSSYYRFATQMGYLIDDALIDRMREGTICTERVLGALINDKQIDCLAARLAPVLLHEFTHTEWSGNKPTVDVGESILRPFEPYGWKNSISKSPSDQLLYADNFTYLGMLAWLIPVKGLTTDDNG